jgi:transposase
MAATIGGVFSHDQEHQHQLQERLHQGPGAEAQAQAAATAQGPPPSRWTLASIRATFDWLADYTVSGVWRYLQRSGLRLRSARVQQFSPDRSTRTKCGTWRWPCGKRGVTRTA